MQYTPHEHKHNFSVWAAARATQRGFATVSELRTALDQCGVEQFARQPKKLGSFDEFHRDWCKTICAHLQSGGKANVAYGRAAKLVNVYLKSMVVLPDMDGKAAAIIHPPIDRRLLLSIASDTSVDLRHREVCRRIKWTQLDEDKYFDLVAILKSIIGDKPLWMIEKYWEPF
ncbi:hypothetical protein F0M18_00350 [Pseudohalioglobus sediminis]|uniref:Uncharacterized protein n=1 Tax=Pseudohalioglobus sediminis TaxID=2606449 RepID=A0A5B0X3S7_9GAMM|nr:hypothetical protein [Pseudohalioglobus sediminis]KAA1193933.1 hypothetical protein F0M18_00350 [Pseudohalioglobus sediminis]